MCVHCTVTLITYNYSHIKCIVLYSTRIAMYSYEAQLKQQGNQLPILEAENILKILMQIAYW